MAAQSRLRTTLDSAKLESINRLLAFTSLYGRNYASIQRVLRVVYLIGVACGMILMFAPKSQNKKSSKKSAANESRKKSNRPDAALISPPNAQKKRVAIDRVFYARLFRLLRITFPTWRSASFGHLIGLSFTLLLRTLISLYVAELDGRIVSSLVRGDKALFLRRVVAWMCIAVPAVLTNSMISFFVNSLSLSIRSRLTNVIQNVYLKNLTFYKLTNLDDRIRNADQLLTVDVQKFSRAISLLYGNIFMPMIDSIVYNLRLSQTVGVEMLIMTTTVIRLTAMLVKVLTPPFGQYAATEQQLEGEYRFSHARLLENAEEIGFYRGQELEKKLIDRSYFSLLKHMNRIFHIRIYYGMMEESIVKWLWGAIGLVICSAPVFFKIPGFITRGIKSDAGSRTETFVTNRRLLLSTSDAFGRVMLSYKEMSELAGYTSRLTELMEVMDEINSGRAKKRLVTSVGQEAIDQKNEIFSRRGEIIEGTDEVVFEDVPIVSPNGDVLLEKLSFRIEPGNNLLIIGPNGCGKSSMFRILGGLWPVYGGRVYKPANHDFTYIPQRPYLSLGSLRDQIIYPDTVDEMHAKGIKDEDLVDILKLLQIDNIVEREGGWDVEREWRDALSGGDKQRIAMARLFYHKPKYAILDECTSAVTLEIERIMYEHATDLGITMLTVSHRPSLWKYHSHVLQYDGQGGYVFTELDADKRLKLQDEKQQLEQNLLLLPKWQERLRDLQGIKTAHERLIRSSGHGNQQKESTSQPPKQGESAKQNQTLRQESQKDESKPEPSQQDQTSKQESKKDESKPEPSQQDQTSKQESKKDESKPEPSQQDQTSEQESRIEDSKPEQPKQESKQRSKDEDSRQEPPKIQNEIPAAGAKVSQPPKLKKKASKKSQSLKSPSDLAGEVPSKSPENGDGKVGKPAPAIDFASIHQHPKK